MKTVLTALLVFISCICSAQKLMIPYRSDTLFGLCDESGKILVTPQFDRVKWIEGSWFSTHDKRKLTDTLTTKEGKRIIRRDIEVSLSGLLHDGKIILKDEPFSEYEIIADKCIAAQYEGRQEHLTRTQYEKYGNARKFYSLFNLKGENLFRDNFRYLQKIDTAGTSSKDKKTGRYILFMAQHLDNTYSMFVFDADQQKISDWLVKDAYKIDGDERRSTRKLLVFDVVDEAGERHRKVLDDNTGKFTLHSVSTAAPRTDASREGGSRMVERPEVVSDGWDMGHGVDAIPPDEKAGPAVAPKFNPYYIFVRDTLYYLTSYEDKHPVKLSAGGKVILTEPRAMTQYQPVIVKNEDHFYIVKEDKPGTVAYDSLIYFGNHFLAWKNINGHIKAGVIDANDSVIVPLEYDSIYADIRLFSIEYSYPASNQDNRIVFKEADAKYAYSSFYPYRRSPASYLTVVKKGRWGVIGMNGDVIIPMEYDMIARNNMDYSKPMEDDFILLRQNNHYGMATLKSGSERPLELSIMVPPVLEYIPFFYYPDYYGIKGYKLIGLYNENRVFKGYASGNGKPFYKD